MSDKPTFSLLRACAIKAKAAQSFSHPWNPLSEVRGVRMGFDGGLRRTGVSLACIAPGKESFCYHSHAREEEWLYVLEGRGVLEVDDASHELGAGDFVAFPTPSVAHHLRNRFEADLVYLMGGEACDLEIADFPRLGRRMIRMKEHVDVVPLEACKPFPG